jgi:hypothetical protein
MNGGEGVEPKVLTVGWIGSIGNDQAGEII